MTSSSATAEILQSSLASGAVSCVVASSSLSTRRVGFVVDDGGAALSTGVAPDRRVGLGFGELAVRRLRPAGWVVFDNAVRWALA